MPEMVSLIIPTYNEKDNVVPLVERISRAFSGRGYEILFVDDDSRDGTAECVQSLAGKYPVRVHVRRGKKGLASAVVDGLALARGDIIGVMDADLQHPPEVLPDLLKAIEDGADIAIASRYVPGGGSENFSALRRLQSKGATFLAHLFLPMTRPVTDPLSGYFFFRKSVVDGATLNPTGYKILLEVLVQGKHRKTVDVPFIFKSRHAGESKLKLRQQIEFLSHVWSLMRRHGEVARFLKFVLVGASGVLVNEGLLWFFTEIIGLFYLISSAIGIETSIITNFLLNDYITFRDRRQRGARQFLARLVKFNAVSFGGIALNWSLLWLFTSVFGVHYLISNLIGIAAAMVWNYIANFLWTWK